MNLVNKKDYNFFKKNGYLKLTNVFSNQEIIKLKKYVNEIEKFKEKKNKYMLYYDNFKGVNFLTRTENFLPYHKKINQFFKKKKISSLVDALIKYKSIIFKDKINWKYPRAKGFEPHQDAQVWEYLYPKIKTFISLSISIDKTNKKNGSLEVVGKMHKKGLLGNNKSAINKKLVKKMKWKRLNTNPGDIIFFDSYTPHRSGTNLSNSPRRIIYLTYNARKDGDLKKEYFINKRNSFPPNIDRVKGKKYKYLI